MATAHRRPSMIALRATHEAFRIASEIGHPPIEVDRITCPQCGQELDWQHNTYGEVVTCIRCGGVTDLPPYLRPHVAGRPTAFERAAQIAYAPLRFFVVCDPYGPVPAWLPIVGAVSVLGVIGYLIVTLMSLHK